MQKREIQETPLYSLKLYNFFLYGAMVIFSSFFPLYLQDIGMDKLEIGSLMAIGPFVSVFANPFGAIQATGAVTSDVFYYL